MTDFVDFVLLLAAIDLEQLEAIAAAIGQLPGIVPELQAWIEHAARWECERRSGANCALQPPVSAIAPDQLFAAMGASALISECLRRERRRDVSAVLAFFEGLTRELRCARERGSMPD